MKDETRENLIITTAALLSAVLVVVVGIWLEFHGIYFSFKWFNLLSTTVLVYGIVGYFYKADLKYSARCLAVFCLMVVGHVALYLYLFQRGIGVSSLAIWFTGIPEIGIACVILIVIGGAKIGYRG